MICNIKSEGEKGASQRRDPARCLINKSQRLYHLSGWQSRQLKEIVQRTKATRATRGREKAKARRGERAVVENEEHKLVQVEPELKQQCLGAAKKVQGENKRAQRAF